jgi:predicted secreted acid phosphatase
LRLTRLTAATAVAASAALVAAGTTAHAAGQLNPATSFSYTVHQDGTVVAPTDGSAIPNIDSVKSTIRAYYGATKGADPTYTGSGTAPQIYLPNLSTSPYAKQVKAIATALKSTLTGPGAGKAVVFDVDSTLLSDYAFEEAVNYNYDGTVNANWVGHGMDAVPGMVDLVKTLKERGYALYAVTGRPGAAGPLSATTGQRQPTLDNLHADGYVDAQGADIFTDANTYLKDLVQGDPHFESWVDCNADGNPACSTVEVKASTRAHIEATDNVHVVLNVGDQWSDLAGGSADATQKIPNPSYYLGSADIPGAPARDSEMVQPTTYTMAPDGSTGASATDGDAIPNEGNVVALIRAYYGATGGVANKTSSPYISQLASLEKAWTTQIATACQRGAAKVAAAQTAIVNARADVAEDVATVAKATKAAQKARKAVKRKHGKAKIAAKKRLHAAERTLARAQRTLAHDRKTLAGIAVPKSPAAVFDADDTTLWTYDMEDGSPAAAHPGMQFNFNQTLQNTWVQNGWFPATPGMPALVKAVKAAGCTIVGLTGRNTEQQAATIDNLTKVGYVDAAGTPLFTAANYYTKWLATATAPAYIDCGDDKTCSTIEYKSGTREYLETQKGLDIVANLGDQFSDLHGGYADATYKLPNPTYYLP